MASQQNEGEGNHTAAKQYNDAQTDFANSDRVKPAADDAARAIEGSEAKELNRAVEESKQRARGEDPAVKGPDRS